MRDLTTVEFRPALVNAISLRLIVLAKLICYELRWAMTNSSKWRNLNFDGINLFVK